MSLNKICLMSYALTKYIFDNISVISLPLFMAIIGLNYVLFLILVCDIANTMDQDQIGPL